jgi:hypothetical protein
LEDGGIEDIAHLLRGVQFGSRDMTHTNVIPAEAEAIVSSKEAFGRSHDIPNLFDSKDIGYGSE